MAAYKPNCGLEVVSFGVNAVAKTGGSVLGVTVGCLLGMVPLLWMDAPQREPEKRAAEAN